MTKLRKKTEDQKELMINIFVFTFCALLLFFLKPICKAFTIFNTYLDTQIFNS